VAGRRRSAGEVSQGCRDTAASNTHEGWIDRGAGTVSQSQWRRRFRPDCRVALGGLAARYPLLAVSGEQGSSKTVLSKILRALVDPNAAPVRSAPREERDLFIAAGNGHLLAFDNLSDLPPWISDALCRLASGGSFALRQLYTDNEETLFEAARPAILNGIEDIISRPDLADRSIFLKGTSKNCCGFQSPASWG
jgi:hypothetical protein